MNNLQKLSSTYNQSPWLDNLSRDIIQNGQLQDYIDNGVRGITSNPTILEKAITASTLYDDQIKSLSGIGKSAEEIYWQIVEDDIKAAAALLRPVWETSGGVDGYVSLEVSPDLSKETDSTIEQAKKLWDQLDAPNVMIKVPATDAGIPAVGELLASGINVNITLIFSLDHYKKVAEAHRNTHKLGKINNARGVASFFVSRVDTEVDKRLEAIGTEQALNLRGQAAIAQAHLAYKIFLDTFGDAAILEPASSAVQRLLWASTSTKNPAYDDLLYVKYLVAPWTVNTLPEDTIAKINDHLGDDVRSLTLEDIAHAKEVFDKLAIVGVNIDDVARTLESEGVKKFQDSFASLLSAIEAKSKL